MLGLGAWVLFAHARQRLTNRSSGESSVAANLFKKYETDKQLENEGVEIEIDGAIFICRRAGGGNRKYRAAIGLAAAAPDIQKRLNSTDKVESLAADDEATMQAFAESVVVGWREILDRNDQPLEFSKENFLDLMRSCPDVWLELRLAARDVDKFRSVQANTVGEELGKS